LGRAGLRFTSKPWIKKKGEESNSSNSAGIIHGGELLGRTHEYGECPDGEEQGIFAWEDTGEMEPIYGARPKKKREARHDIRRDSGLSSGRRRILLENVERSYVQSLKDRGDQKDLSKTVVRPGGRSSGDTTKKGLDRRQEKNQKGIERVQRGSRGKKLVFR